MRMIRVEEKIIRRIEEESRRSIRRSTKKKYLIDNKSNECITLKSLQCFKKDMHSYYFSLVQHLQEGDAEHYRIILSVINISQQQRQYILYSNFIFRRVFVYTREIV